MSEAVGLKELLRRKIKENSDEVDKRRATRAALETKYAEGGVVRGGTDEFKFVADKFELRDHTGKVHLSSDEPTPLRTTAQGLLSKARDHMLDRAATYDKPEGERSMGRAVEAFNAITGRDLEESEGWLLLQVLKDVRDRQRREPHSDSLEDCIAYAALKAEARIAGK